MSRATAAASRPSLAAMLNFISAPTGRRGTGASGCVRDVVHRSEKRAVVARASRSGGPWRFGTVIMNLRGPIFHLYRARRQDKLRGGGIWLPVAMNEGDGE